MKQKKNKPVIIDFGNNESTKTLFEKIKSWEITSQVEVAVSFDKPERKELFEKIFETVSDEIVKQNIYLIVQRIEQAAFQVSGYTPSEIEYYQSLFAKHFYMVLHSENYQTYIENKIRELHFYSKGLEQDLITNKYEFLEDREQDKRQLIEAERYKVYLENLLIHLNTPAPQPIVKKKPEANGKLITFKNSETIDKLHSELKGYFLNKEAELLKALQGEQLGEILLFPHNASSFVEVFKRLKYNGLLISTPTEIKDWICKNFNFLKTQGTKKTVEDFKENTVWDILTKTKCEPSKKNRICKPEWLPFIPQKTRQRETENEKL